MSHHEPAPSLRYTKIAEEVIRAEGLDWQKIDPDPKQIPSEVQIKQRIRTEYPTQAKEILRKINEQTKIKNHNDAEKENLKIDTLGNFILALDQDILQVFADEQQNGWIKYLDNGQTQFCQIQSQQFSDYIRIKTFEYTDAPKENWVQATINHYDSRSRRTEIKHLYLRHANNTEGILIQTKPVEAIQITQKGDRKIITDCTDFRNLSHQKNIIVAEKTNLDEYDKLKELLNFKSENETELFLDLLPAYFLPNISKPIALVRGPPGSGKTFFCKLLKQLIDPSISTEGLAFPKNDGDWIVQTRQHAFLFYDNLRNLNTYQQDALCRLVTGHSVEQRTLYTNFGTSHAYIKGTGAINSIDLSNLQSDLLDRSIIFDLERIPNEQRISEAKFWDQFNAIAPKVRTCIINILSDALPILSDTDTAGILRLSDFERAIIACGIARGRKRDDIIAALQIKGLLQQDESLLHNPIADPLLQFMEDKTEWTGSSKELLRELTAQEYPNESKPSDDFPKTPEKLSNEIMKISYILKYNGLEIERLPRKTRARLWQIRKFANQPSQPSQPSYKGDLSTTRKDDSSRNQTVIQKPTVTLETQKSDSYDSSMTVQETKPSYILLDDKNCKGDSMTVKSLEVIKTSELLDRIKRLDDGSGVDYDLIVSCAGEDVVVNALANGDIFQPKAGRLKVLE